MSEFDTSEVDVETSFEGGAPAAPKALRCNIPPGWLVEQDEASVHIQHPLGTGVVLAQRGTCRSMEARVLRELARDMLAPWDELAERREFEDMAYEHYLKRRKQLRARGQVLVGDDLQQEQPRAVLFERGGIRGDYVIWAYQAAWSGWKMARGGV